MILLSFTVDYCSCSIIRRVSATKMRVARLIVATIPSLLRSVDSVEVPIASYDGFGNAVDWFFVLKLPKETFEAKDLWQIEASYGYPDLDALNVSDVHCDCPDPTCVGMPFPEYGAGKGSGLCYLYADANHPTLRYFQDVVDEATGQSLECLGQGGRDPLSQTLMRGAQNRRNFDDSSVEWAFWNDEFQATSSSYVANVCGYSAYSDESLPYTFCTSDDECGQRCSSSPYAPCDELGEDDPICGGSTCKQISCASKDLPAYYNACGSPYAHSKGAMCFEENSTGYWLQVTTPNWPDPSTKDKFAPLGCQLDNNTFLGQSFMGLTLSASELQRAAPVLQTARLCSTGTTSCANGTAGHLTDYTCTSAQTRDAEWSILDTVFAGTSTTGMSSQSMELTTVGGNTVTLFSHAKDDEVPPWLLVASGLGVDLGVANWWENQYGFASICQGDDYSAATNNMCLVDESAGLSLNANGGAAQSVENAIAASFEINGQDRAWAMYGSFHSIHSHAKFGVAATHDPTQAWVVSGDENNQGFGCSTTCGASQNGRGGLSLAVKSPALHASVYQLLKIVCACNQMSAATKRFCYFGCYHKDSTSWLPDPPVPMQATSFWDQNQKSWYP